MKVIIEKLRNLSMKDKISIETDEGEYTAYVVGDPEYEEPDRYGAGFVSVNVELDNNVHDIPTDELPTESGDIMASTSVGGTTFNPPMLNVWSPVTDDDVIVDDEWISLGKVESIDILD